LTPEIPELLPVPKGYPELLKSCCFKSLRLLCIEVIELNVCEGDLGVDGGEMIVDDNKSVTISWPLRTELLSINL